MQKTRLNYIPIDLLLINLYLLLNGDRPIIIEWFLWKESKYVQAATLCEALLSVKQLNSKLLGEIFALTPPDEWQLTGETKETKITWGEIRKQMIKHPSFPADLAMKYIQDPKYKQYESLFLKYCALDEDYALQIALSNNKRDIERCEFLAQNENMSAKVLGALNNHSVMVIRQLVTKNPSCPMNIIEQTIDSATVGQLSSILSNPNITTEIWGRVATIVETKFPQIYGKLIGHRVANMDVVKRYLTSETYKQKGGDEQMRELEEVVTNESITAEICRLLLEKSEVYFGSKLILNPGCPSEILQYLFYKVPDLTVQVRAKITQHLKIKPFISKFVGMTDWIEEISVLHWNETWFSQSGLMSTEQILNKLNNTVETGLQAQLFKSAILIQEKERLKYSNNYKV